MAKIKIAFFDIDNTIFDGEKKVFPSSTVEALRRLQENGVKVFVCTSRPNDSIRELGTFNLGINWDGVIGSSGGTAMIGDKFIRKYTLPKDESYRFVDYVIKHNICTEAISLFSRKLLSPLDECGKIFYTKFHEFEPEVGVYEGEELTQFHVMARDNVDEDLIKNFPSFIFFRYYEFGIDVTTKLYFKGDAIVDVLDYYGFTKEESIGFGDDLQDISIARNVGTFVAMGNAKDEVKEVAHIITDSVSEDGIRNALIKLNLI